MRESVGTGERERGRQRGRGRGGMPCLKCGKCGKPGSVRLLSCLASKLCQAVPLHPTLCTLREEPCVCQGVATGGQGRGQGTVGLGGGRVRGSRVRGRRIRGRRTW